MPDPTPGDTRGDERGCAVCGRLLVRSEDGPGLACTIHGEYGASTDPSSPSGPSEDAVERGARALWEDDNPSVPWAQAPFKLRTILAQRVKLVLSAASPPEADRQGGEGELREAELRLNSMTGFPPLEEDDDVVAVGRLRELVKRYRRPMVDDGVKPSERLHVLKVRSVDAEVRAEAAEQERDQARLQVLELVEGQPGLFRNGMGDEFVGAARFHELHDELDDVRQERDRLRAEVERWEKRFDKWQDWRTHEALSPSARGEGSYRVVRGEE